MTKRQRELLISLLDRENPMVVRENQEWKELHERGLVTFTKTSSNTWNAEATEAGLFFGRVEAQKVLERLRSIEVEHIELFRQYGTTRCHCFACVGSRALRERETT